MLVSSGSVDHIVKMKQTKQHFHNPKNFIPLKRFSRNQNEFKSEPNVDKYKIKPINRGASTSIGFYNVKMDHNSSKPKQWFPILQKSQSRIDNNISIIENFNLGTLPPVTSNILDSHWRN